MKQFHDETIRRDGVVAHTVIQVAWRVLRMVRAEVERRPTPELTLTQMQSLGFLISNPGASLSELAEHLGLQKPTTSKVVEELVQQGRVIREVAPGNRRKLTLHITASGSEVLGSAIEPAITRMAEMLARLTADERQEVERAMSLLHPLVQPGGSHVRTETNENDADGRSDGRAQRGQMHTA